MIREHTLQHLERDPVVFWGCTFGEIKQAGIRAATFAFPIGIGMGVMPIPYGLNFGAGIISFFTTFFLLFKRSTTKLAKLRSDKPLYFDVHYSKLKTGCFIKAHQSWQRERNAHQPVCHIRHRRNKKSKSTRK